VIALGSLVWAFAAADTRTEVVAEGPVLLPLAAVAAVAFVVRERRASSPVLPLHDLRPRGAWGALLVNLLVGVALVATLVDVPLFARDTTTPGDQLGAALVLMRMLVAVPIGAVAGGWLCRRLPARAVAAAGMALTTLALVLMTGWDERSLDRPASWFVLAAAGLGFGLAIAPVNAVLLGVTRTEVHGSASALAVVARTVGMLVGLSLLTAVALRRFEARVAGIGSPVQLCPRTPADCPAYDKALDAAILAQLHTVFAGAAIAAGLAALAAAALLRARAWKAG
jgi:MFS family permease